MIAFNEAQSLPLIKTLIFYISDIGISIPQQNDGTKLTALRCFCYLGADLRPESDNKK